MKFNRKVKGEIMVFKSGPIMAIVGGVILLLIGLFGLESLLYGYYYYSGDLWETIALYVNAFMTLIWGSIAIFISVSKLKGHISGDNFLLLIGIGGLIGIFIPIYLDQTYYLYSIRLLRTYYIDIGLILVGGILDVAMIGAEQNDLIHRKNIYNKKYEENQKNIKFG